MQNPFDNVIYVCFVWCGGAFLRARVGYFQSSERLAQQIEPNDPRETRGGATPPPRTIQFKESLSLGTSVGKIIVETPFKRGIRALWIPKIGSNSWRTPNRPASSAESQMTGSFPDFRKRRKTGQSYDGENGGYHQQGTFGVYKD